MQEVTISEGFESELVKGKRNALKLLWIFAEKEFKEEMDCKIWDKCKHHSCFREKLKYGSIIWSKQICYALDDLEDKGLIRGFR